MEYFIFELLQNKLPDHAEMYYSQISETVIKSKAFSAGLSVRSDTDLNQTSSQFNCLLRVSATKQKRLSLPHGDLNSESTA